MTCDLHTHSIYSDGSYKPAEIIAETKKPGLTVAIADHNTVSVIHAMTVTESGLSSGIE